MTATSTAPAAPEGVLAGAGRPRSCTFTVFGTPIPQGSKTAFARGGRAQVVDSNKTVLKPWRAEIAYAAREAWAGQEPLDEPVAVHLFFTLNRPASRPKRDRHADRKPDIDKLVRAVLDGITGPLLRDDSRVVRLIAEKLYVGQETATAEPSVVITVRRVNAPPRSDT